MKGVGQRRGNTIPVSKSNSIHSTRPIQFSHKSSNPLKTQNMASSSQGGFDLTREAQNDGGYDSTNEDDEDTVASKRARHDLAGGAKYDKKGKAKAHKREAHEEASFEVGRGMRSKLLTMNAYDRHKSLINSYQLYFPGATATLARDRSNDKRDIDVIREHHKLLWTEDDDEQSWEVQLARRYHDKLFKEYVIIDLSRYKENQFGMRWRVEAEVVAGKGQFVCANVKKLRTWEVNFGYVEHNIKKNALIKCRLCPDCSYKLNYHHKKKELTKKRKKNKKKKKRKKRSRSSSSSSESDSSDDDSRRRKRKKEDHANDAEEKEKELSQQEKDVWTKPQEKEDEKTREDEFDDFMDDLFL